MKSFEERYTAWLDGALTEDERMAFERDLPPGAQRDRDEWSQLRGKLRECIPPAKMPHADFVNSQVAAAIAAEGRRREGGRPAWFPIPRLAFAGAFLVVLSAVLSVWFLSGNSNSTPSLSQIVDARGATSRTNAYAFEAPGRASVLWIDNAGYIPANERL